MRKLMVIGGEGVMSGMSADRIDDDIPGLISGLADDPQHDTVLFHLSPRFLAPPDSAADLIPLFRSLGRIDEVLEGMSTFGEKRVAELIAEGVDDDGLIDLALEHEKDFHTRLQYQATLKALRLFFQTVFSFTGGRNVILIAGKQSEWAEPLMRFCSHAGESCMHRKRVYHESLPAMEAINEWLVLFRRMKGDTVRAGSLFPSDECELHFPWSPPVLMRDVLLTCGYAPECECSVSYPAWDVLNHPRALLLQSPSGGKFLAIPRPSNMSTFAKLVRSGRWLQRETPVRIEKEPEQPVEVERNWMTRKEVADMIQRSKDTVDDLRSEGVLVDAPKAGRQVRITKESVQRYLDGKLTGE